MPSEFEERVFISIGSNLGDRALNCRRAVMLLKGKIPDITVLRLSSLYETPAWGAAEQPDFMNLCVEIRTTHSPQRLLEILKSIEAGMGRTRKDKWGPRIIDLDIVFFGSRVIEEAGITIPHPHAHERGFVMVPLSEIAPSFMHPLLEKTVSELSEGFADVRKAED